MNRQRVLLVALAGIILFAAGLGARNLLLAFTALAIVFLAVGRYTFGRS